MLLFRSSIKSYWNTLVQQFHFILIDDTQTIGFRQGINQRMSNERVTPRKWTLCSKGIKGRLGGRLSTNTNILCDVISESKIPICVVTGQPVTDYQFWMCPTCRHSAYEQEIARLRNCPLCHFPVQ
ncbi:hypothetical protein FGIG_00423 [Fasciola gigantica]|uniref:IFT121-like zinc finger domain-containing protein n=1 Tax=Fasciola gigantica TaxID=46835 RepID=A0A504Y559_FASGI|nr:hypothetical protein FGIG_00423 [Fasciola gigantica]